MNFYQSVFLEKKFLRKYPLIFTLSDQSYDSKNYVLKFRINQKNLNFVIFLLEM